MLHFNVIVRQVMTGSSERIFFYLFNSFLHVENSVVELFFPTKTSVDLPWEEVLAQAVVALTALALVALAIALALRHHPIIHVNCDHM
jgi:hypothetical protein